MRHHSRLLATTEAVDELPKAHSVGKKGTKKMVLSVKIFYRNAMHCVQTET